MARFSALWVEIALAQYATLPASVQADVDDRISQLLERPEGSRAEYDAPRDEWTTTYGRGAGLVVYAVVRGSSRVIVLRLVFLS